MTFFRSYLCLKMIYDTLSGTQSIFLNIRKYLLKLVFIINQYGT